MGIVGSRVRQSLALASQSTKVSSPEESETPSGESVSRPPASPYLCGIYRRDVLSLLTPSEAAECRLMSRLSYTASDRQAPRHCVSSLFIDVVSPISAPTLL